MGHLIRHFSMENHYKLSQTNLQCVNQTDKLLELIFAVFFLKSLSDQDLLIVIHSNFISGNHGYELLLQVR